MFMVRKVVTVVGISLIVASVSTSTFAQSKRTSATAARDVGQLMRMMDKDMNGAVSKDEFIAIHVADIRSSRYQPQWTT
jgi:hypothetical protein